MSDFSLTYGDMHIQGLIDFASINVIILIIIFIFSIQDCTIEEVSDDDETSSKSGKNKKSNGPDKSSNLMFKLTTKIPYKTVLKGMHKYQITVHYRLGFSSSDLSVNSA